MDGDASALSSPIKFAWDSRKPCGPYPFIPFNEPRQCTLYSVFPCVDALLLGRSGALKIKHGLAPVTSSPKPGPTISATNHMVGDGRTTVNEYCKVAQGGLSATAVCEMPEALSHVTSITLQAGS